MQGSNFMQLQVAVRLPPEPLLKRPFSLLNCGCPLVILSCPNFHCAIFTLDFFCFSDYFCSIFSAGPLPSPYSVKIPKGTAYQPSPILFGINPQVLQPFPPPPCADDLQTLCLSQACSLRAPYRNQYLLYGVHFGYLMSNPSITLQKMKYMILASVHPPRKSVFLTVFFFKSYKLHYYPISQVRSLGFSQYPSSSIISIISPSVCILNFST